MKGSMPTPPDEIESQVGPGRLVLVVGSSGAGKDTLIAGAKTACHHNPAIVFPRRTVTRPVSGHEDHDSLTDEAFDVAVGKGAFAFYWQAHGLKYGIPSAVEEDLRSGHTVVCNVSRGIVVDLRLRYARVHTVLVTAPADVLLARLTGRSRETDGSLAQRLSRNDTFAELSADYTIENAGAPETAVRMLLDVISNSSDRMR